MQPELSMKKEDEELSMKTLSAFKTKEEEIEKKKMEIRERVKAQLGRVEDETKRFSIICEGFLMTTLGKTWAADESQLNSSLNGRMSLTGDLFGLLSAVSYGLFTMLLKKFAGEEGEGVDVQKLFGTLDT